MGEQCSMKRGMVCANPEDKREQSTLKEMEKVQSGWNRVKGMSVPAQRWDGRSPRCYWKNEQELDYSGMTLLVRFSMTKLYP